MFCFQVLKQRLKLYVSAFLYLFFWLSSSLAIRNQSGKKKKKKLLLALWPQSRVADRKAGTCRMDGRPWRPFVFPRLGHGSLST